MIFSVLNYKTAARNTSLTFYTTEIRTAFTVHCKKMS